MIESELRRRVLDLQLKAVLRSSRFQPTLIQTVETIKREANRAQNEATVASAFEITIYTILRDLGVPIFPDKEVGIDYVRHVSKRRVDSSIGAVIIEFKHRSKLRTPAQILAATTQITEYLEALSAPGSGKDLHYLGLLTDGLTVQFFHGRNGVVEAESLHALDSRDIWRLLEGILALEAKPLTTRTLVEECCLPKGNSLSERLIRILYDSLRNRPSQKTQMLHSEWERLFKLGHEDKSHQTKIEERGAVLSKVVGLDRLSSADQYRVLFCLQTAYAILVKLIAYRILSDLVFRKPLQSFKSLGKGDDRALKSFFVDFEDGSLFRAIGIENLLEGDFFSWYTGADQWDERIAQILREAVTRLSDYEDQRSVLNQRHLSDLFRDLYLEVMPEVVRYSLGEYYTPRWLAEQMLEGCVDGKVGWSGLDPCAGSGTFVLAMIERVLQETEEQAPDRRLEQVLSRVKAIDINPLAVLTARVNYFVAISDLLPEGIEFVEIPVYLGDSANLPREVMIDGVACYQHRIETKLGPVDVTLPVSIVRVGADFSKALVDFERRIIQNQPTGAASALLSLLPKNERTPIIEKSIIELAETMVHFEGQHWNRIWPRIIKNFMLCAALEPVDVIIGNPPWIDWKNLPTGYRNTIKSLCVKKELFSGDRLTGGINLNICALITSVVAERWLDDKGTMAFLMPKPILFQQSYDGFRRLHSDRSMPLRFLGVHDWTEAGHPFYPVTQEFLTYYLGFRAKSPAVLPVLKFRAARGARSTIRQNDSWEDVSGQFTTTSLVMGQVSQLNTAYTYARDKTELDRFRVIAGECAYVGREGIEFYPQEVMLFTLDRKAGRSRTGTVWVSNFQGPKSKYKLPKRSILVETRYLYPLVKGIDVQKFTVASPEYVVPFPYEPEDPRTPLTEKVLRERSPLLLRYFESCKQVLLDQSEYNTRIQGKYATAYYGLTRVGDYTFAPVHVVFRDNTKWGAAVVSSLSVPWDDHRKVLFQNHAGSISERSDGAAMTEDEAHYVCAILNAPICESFIVQSSDSRTFKIRPPVKIPPYNRQNPLCVRLSELSRDAHDNPDRIDQIREEIDSIYLDLCRIEESSSEETEEAVSIDRPVGATSAGQGRARRA